MLENFFDVKVMFVDDSKTIRRTADILLSKTGCSVITAIDGFDALAKVVMARPSIIFVDTIMPRLDGYQTCALIKNNNELKNIPIVMSSRNSDLFSRSKGRICGANKFLKKPFSKDQLFNVISNQIVDDISRSTLSPMPLATADEVIQEFRLLNGEAKMRKAVKFYNQALTQLLENIETRRNLATILKLFKLISKICGQSPMGNLAKLSVSFVQGIAGGRIKLNSISVRLLRSIEIEISQLDEAGSRGLRKPIDEILVEGLVRLIKDSINKTNRNSEIGHFQSFDEVIGQSISTLPELETKAIVAGILIEELDLVTGKLDTCIRSSKKALADVVSVTPALERISSAMVFAVDRELQELCAAQIELVHRIQCGDEHFQDGVKAISDALMGIKRSLESLAEKRFKKSLFGDFEEADKSLIDEVRAGLGFSKKVVIAYIESELNDEKVKLLPDFLKSLAGKLFQIKQDRAGNMLSKLAKFVYSKVLIDKSSIEDNQFDDFADVLISVDHYLLRLLRSTDDSTLQFLDLGEAAIKRLGESFSKKIDATEGYNLVLSDQVEGNEAWYSNEFEDVENLVEEIGLQETITDATKALDQLERLMHPSIKKSHPTSDE